MSDEKPTKRDLDALLRDARRDVASPAQERALLASLAAAIEAGGGPGGAGGASNSNVRPKRILPRAPVGVGLSLAVGVAVWLAATRHSNPIAVAVPDAAVAYASPPQQVVPTTAAATPGPSAQPASSAQELAAPRASSAAGGAETRRGKRLAVPQESEASLIEAARATVRRDPQRALALTETHKKLFPSGDLVPEREVVAIEALSRLGRRDDASSRADSFRAAHPGSIFASRIAAILSGEKNLPAK